MANRRIVAYNAADVADDPESKEKVYRSREYRGPNRRIRIGVAEDGDIFIKARRLVNGKVVVSTVCYSSEAVGCILREIKCGTESWAKKTREGE